MTSNEPESVSEQLTTGPRLIRHPVATTELVPVSDEIYLAAYLNSRPSPGAVRRVFRHPVRRIRPEWKVAGLSAAVGVVVTLAVMASFHKPSSSVGAARVTTSAGVGEGSKITAERPAASSDPSSAAATESDKLVARNRRLEALVEVLRERRKSRAETRVSRISTN